MRFFKRGEIAVSKFTFLDMLSGEPIDVSNATFIIVYYSGLVETEITQAALEKLLNKTGEYICQWEIPNTVPENETYFVTAKGTHPDGSTTLIEDFYRVVSDNYFSNGASIGGMVAKFTKS